MYPEAEFAQPEPMVLPSAAEDDSDWPIWQPAKEDEQTPPAKVEVPAIQSPILTEQVAALRNFGKRFLAAAQAHRILLDDRLFIRTATLTAAMAILLLVIGVTAHRFSPLPARILHGSSQASQSVPFHRPAAAPALTAAGEVVPAEAAEPGTLHVTIASAHSRARQSSRPAVNSSHSNNSGNDYVAEDTVVRYHQHLKRTLPETAKKEARVKYYTDLKQ